MKKTVFNSLHQRLLNCFWKNGYTMRSLSDVLCYFHFSFQLWRSSVWVINAVIYLIWVRFTAWYLWSLHIFITSIFLCAVGLYWQTHFFYITCNFYFLILHCKHELPFPTHYTNKHISYSFMIKVKCLSYQVHGPCLWKKDRNMKESLVRKWRS